MARFIDAIKDIDRDVLEMIKAYLIDGLSYRDIERNILKIDSQTRGGGYKAMKILHGLGINGNKKGVLKHNAIEKEIKNATGEYLKTLNFIKDKI
jgi:putative restriction endonuclease